MKSPARPFLRNPFNYDVDRASLVSGLSCPEPTLAQQQFKDECDINVIAERFGLTGQLPVNARMPTFGDFTGVSDYQSALNAVIAARDAFMLMPANVRERFSNDPQRFVEFCSDPANLEEARALGLAPPAPPSPAGDTPAPPTT